jgi:hypothetical protein
MCDGGEFSPGGGPRGGEFGGLEWSLVSPAIALLLVEKTQLKLEEL